MQGRDPIRRALWWSLCVSVSLWAATAWAIDAARAGEALAHQAAAAYEAGDHAKAARLYKEAYKADPAGTIYLFGAARELEIHGDLDQADELYRRYLGLPNIDPSRAEKAQAHLDDIGRTRADQKATEAEEALGRRNPALAARLFQAAYLLDVRRPIFLKRAALAADSAGDRALAIECLKKFLYDAPRQDMEREEAQLRLDVLEGRIRPAPESRPEARPEAHNEPGEVTPAATPPTTARAGDERGEKASGGPAWAPWVLVGLGAVALGLGVAWNVGYNHPPPGYAQNPAQQTASVAAYATGGALVAGGLGWWLWQAVNAPPPKQAAGQGRGSGNGGIDAQD